MDLKGYKLLVYIYIYNKLVRNIACTIEHVYCLLSRDFLAALYKSKSMPHMLGDGELC